MNPLINSACAAYGVCVVREVAKLFCQITDIYDKRLVVLACQIHSRLQREIIASTAKDHIVFRYVHLRFNEGPKLSFPYIKEFIRNILVYRVSGLIIMCLIPFPEGHREGLHTLLTVAEDRTFPIAVTQMATETYDARCIGRRSDAIG